MNILTNCKERVITFNVVTLEDSIRIPPNKFGEPLEEVAREQLKIKYEGIIDEELGYVIAVTDIKVSPVGKIIPGDGATYHKATFSLLTFYPKVQEIVEGEVVETAVVRTRILFPTVTFLLDSLPMRTP